MDKNTRTLVNVKRRSVVVGVLSASVAFTIGFAAQSGLLRRKPDLENVSYGQNERQVLDIYLPEGQDPFPFVVDIHGGAFKIGSKDQTQPSSELLSAGIALVRPNYRLSTTDKWPAQSLDCLAAIQFLLNNATELNLDPARFAVWGQSAGAFLAVSAGLDLIELGTPPRAIVDFYGPMDFSTMDTDMERLNRVATTGLTNAEDSAESLLLGFSVGANPKAARAMGPIGRLEKMPRQSLPPLFVRHGDADMFIAHGQSERLVAAWKTTDSESTVDFSLVPGAGHGGSEFDGAEVMAPMVEFLQKAFA